MKQIVILMSLLSVIFGSKTPQNLAIQVLTPEVFRTQVEGKNVQLVDVRTYREYKNGYIDDAINIDFNSGKFNVEFNKFNKENAIYVYCKSEIGRASCRERV